MSALFKKTRPSQYGPYHMTLTVQVPYSAQFGLERLACYYNLNHSQMLNKLIADAHHELLAKLTDRQADDYLHMQLQEAYR